MNPQAPDLDTLFQTERWLDEGFVSVLTLGGVSNPLPSRTGETLQSPYTTIYCTTGEILGDHQFYRQGSPGKLKFFDIFSGNLVTEVVTNRVDEEGQPTLHNHVKMLGKLRKSLQVPFILSHWDTDFYLEIIDCRQEQTIDSFVDEDSLDHSQISWYLVYRYTLASWPANLLV